MRDRFLLANYAEVIRMWGHRMDTKAIADRLRMPEHLVARYVTNFRDVTREAALDRADAVIQAGAYDA